MDKINPKFQSKLERHPKEDVRLIVRVVGDPALAAAWLTQRGATVLRSFTLIKAVSISCPAEMALSLLQEPWVEAVEEDRRVFTQEAGTGGKGRKT